MSGLMGGDTVLFKKDSEETSENDSRAQGTSASVRDSSDRGRRERESKEGTGEEGMAPNVSSSIPKHSKAQARHKLQEIEQEIFGSRRLSISLEAGEGL
jgi:hypothetical protein